MPENGKDLRADLIRAVLSGDRTKVAALLDAGADIKARAGKTG